MGWFVLLLVVLPLALWVRAQNQRIDALMRRVAELERLLAQQSGAAAPAPERAPEPEPAPDTPTPAYQQEPLLLDTPVPEASNDTAAPAPAPPREEEPLLLTEIVPPDAEEPVPFPPAATPPPRVARTRGLEQWLAEKGLAWLGGGALALAGVFLVSFAAQQDWFTPRVQLVCAVLFGAALIGASEWARRVGLARPPGHPLVAAMLAGAGVVALYATAWAAHGLYGMLDAGAAAALLTLCAAALVGLSFLHGQALGVLAIIMALLAPPFASSQLWPSNALSLYVGGVGAAGFGLAALRRWAWVGAAVLAGLYFWFAAAIAADDLRRALTLASFAALGGVGVAFRKPVADEPEGQLTWTRAHAHLPAIAISLSSVLVMWTWMLAASAPAGLVAGPAWVSAMFVVLAAAAVRARAAAPPAFVVAVGALVLGFVFYLQARFYAPALGADFYPFILFAVAAVVLSALYAQPHHSARTLIAAAGAVVAALLTTLAAFTRSEWRHLSAWLPLFAGAALLFAAAWVAARSAADQRTDRAVAFWSAAGAALLLLGLESAVPDALRTAAHAAASLLFAAAFVWRGWTIFRHLALAAAALALAHALSPALIGAALAGTMPLITALAILAAAALFAFCAGLVIGRVEPRGWVGEALTSAAALIVLIGVFLALRWVAAGGAGAPLGAFSEASLRALALIAAGHLLLPRQKQETGVISAWRGHVLMGAGLAYALLLPGVAINPWWGAAPAQVSGPIVFDTLALAFAAPAALAFAAARRLYMRQRVPARVYAGAGGALGLIWALLLIRRAFRGAEMASAAVGLFEAACYALILLAAACAIAFVGRRAIDAPERRFAQDLAYISRGAAWFALAAATFILLLARHPWWGMQDVDTTNALSTLLAVVAQLAAVPLTLALGRGVSRSPEVEPARFAAAAAAVLFAWSFGHAAVRWLYHAGYMDNSAPLTGVEGLLHTTWPLAFVVGAALLTARAPHAATLRPYIFDLQAIWSAAAWPALAFAALGLWLLFNPWWGAAPADMAAPLVAAAALAIYAAAAWLSAAARDIPHLRKPDWFADAAVVAVVGHLLSGATLLVRRLAHADAVASAPVTNAEVWTYSALWALFGAGLYWLGVRRNEALQRWLSLAILLSTWVYAVIMAWLRLDGFARAGSLIGLAAVLLAVTWFARSHRDGAPSGASDLLNVTPGARRERRHGRRQRS